MCESNGFALPRKRLKYPSMCIMVHGVMHGRTTACLHDRVGVQTPLWSGSGLRAGIVSGAQSLLRLARAVSRNVASGVFKLRCGPKGTRPPTHYNSTRDTYLPLSQIDFVFAIERRPSFDKRLFSCAATSTERSFTEAARFFFSSTPCHSRCPRYFESLDL